MKPTFKLISVFVFLLLLGSCYMSYFQELEGSWNMEGENRYKEKITFHSKEKNFEWIQISGFTLEVVEGVETQVDNIVCQSSGSYVTQTSLFNGKTVPVIILKFNYETGTENYPKEVPLMFEIQTGKNAKSLKLIGQCSTLYEYEIPAKQPETTGGQQ